jgi:hypothetical protein
MGLKDVLKPKPQAEIDQEIKEIVDNFAHYKYDDIIGKTITRIERITDGEDQLHFYFDTGEKWVMLHYQDCCEYVYIENIIGDLDDLIGSPLTMAEERCGENPYASESGTWTFYTFATIKGYVDIRWNGESNGYYSESVSFGKEGED